MADLVKKHSISSELAQKLVEKAVAKARELGVSENVTILDDGGNLRAFTRMDGAPILSIEMSQSKAYTAHESTAADRSYLEWDLEALDQRFQGVTVLTLDGSGLISNVALHHPSARRPPLHLS